MFALCVEASHKKGMGHLYRALNFADYLKSVNEQFIFLVNNDVQTFFVLDSKKYFFEVVNLNDYTSNWESFYIDKYKIKYWINDRLSTDINHTQNVISNNIKIINFDDFGEGASLCNLNISGLPCIFNKQLEGKKVLKGVEVLIVNRDIQENIRKRTEFNKILVFMGGCDTHNITYKIIDILKRASLKADIVLGFGYKDIESLNRIISDNFIIINKPENIIKLYYDYDILISTGGIIPFEASASGLPSIIVPSEIHEIVNANYLEFNGCAVNAGYYQENIENKIIMAIEDTQKLTQMSDRGINIIGKKLFGAAKNIYEAIISL